MRTVVLLLCLVLSGCSDSFQSQMAEVKRLQAEHPLPPKKDPSLHLGMTLQEAIDELHSAYPPYIISRTSKDTDGMLFIQLDEESSWIDAVRNHCFLAVRGNVVIYAEFQYY